MSLLLKLDSRPRAEPQVSTPLPERLVSGDPRFSTWGQEEAFVANSKVSSGVWEATPGQTRSVKGATWEFCHILEGLVELTEDGKEPRRFGAGETFVMRPGYTGVWETIETVRKFYVVIEPR